jgi:hypothetical protein
MLLKTITKYQHLPGCFAEVIFVSANNNRFIQKLNL